VEDSETNGDQAGAPDPEAPLPPRSGRVAVSACPWRDDFDYIVALHIDPLPCQAFIVFSVFLEEPQAFDDALESDLATSAREITYRHGVDKRSLLPLAARRDVVARNAKPHGAPSRGSYSAETSKPRFSAKPATNAVAACTTGAARFMQASTPYPFPS